MRKGQISGSCVINEASIAPRLPMAELFLLLILGEGYLKLSHRARVRINYVFIWGFLLISLQDLELK